MSRKRRDVFMETRLISETLTAVNLFLKDGRRLCGQLLDNPEQNHQGPWKFISNNNFQEYLQSHDARCIQVFSTEVIDHIDPYLK